MATSKQKEAARQNLKKARAAHSARAQGKNVPRRTEGLSTAEQDRLAVSGVVRHAEILAARWAVLGR